MNKENEERYCNRCKYLNRCPFRDISNDFCEGQCFKEGKPLERKTDHRFGIPKSDKLIVWKKTIIPVSILTIAITALLVYAILTGQAKTIIL